MSNQTWVEVTRKNICTKCNGVNWCSRSSDGHFELCRRVNDGTAITRTDKNGSDYHLYYVGPIPGYTSKFSPPKYRKSPEPEQRIEQMRLASDEELHLVYSALLDILVLKREHRVQLVKRGLPEHEIDKGQYRSMPLQDRIVVEQKMQKKIDSNILLKVPGFYRNNNGYLKLAGAPGLLIPIRDFSGKIIALKVRRDISEADNMPKYLWISSVKKGGLSPGAPIHIPLMGQIALSRTRITEGELKADIATALSSLPTISIPGVTTWKPILSIIKTMKITTVVLAIDADASSNRNVATALSKMAMAIKEIGCEVEIEIWDGNKAKGIDDALVNQVEVITHRGASTFGVINKIVKAAVTANPTTDEAKLQNARVLISEINDMIKSNPGLAFQQDVLRALILIEIEDVGLWTEFRTKASGAKISLRTLEQNMNKERSEQYREAARNSHSDSKNKESNWSKRGSSNNNGYADGENSFKKKYEVIDNQIIWNKKTQDDVVQIPLSNFSAIIEAEEIIDDGVDEKKTLAISGKLKNGRSLPKVQVPADQFNSMSWIMPGWGPSANPTAGMGTKDHLRAAIQDLSEGQIKHKISYGHTGWRKIDSEWFYFFNGGAISKNGLEEKFNVSLGLDKLKNFDLPVPLKREDLILAIKASLDFLHLAPAKITYPSFAAVYRSIFGELSPVVFSIFLYGITGVGKSQLAALVQAHFGMGFTDQNFLGNWSSTVNSLEMLTSTIKDAVCIIDDFAPQPSQNDKNALMAKAERLLRAQGNRSGRGRLDSSIQQRAERFPRGLIFSTGEDLPMGASLRGRILILEISKNDISFSKLTSLQSNAMRGLYAQSVSGFVQWLAPQMDKLKDEIHSRHIEIRNSLTAHGTHRRSPDMAASLTLGMDLFLKYARTSGAITSEEADQHIAKFNVALSEAMEAQGVHQISEDPAVRFFELLSSAISSGRAHVADQKTTSVPQNAEAWGWQIDGSVFVGQDKTTSNTYRPKGDLVGWLPDDGQLWLNPSTAYAVVQKLATDQKTSFTTTEQTLWKQLAERNVLILPEKEPRNKIRVTIGESRRRVIAIRDKNILFEGIPNVSEVPVSKGEKKPGDEDMPEEPVNYANNVAGEKTGTGKKAEDEV